MAYAAIADLRAYIPGGLVAFGPQSHPTEGEVLRWLDELSAWIDAALRWRYAVPVSHATDLQLVRGPCAMLTAARVWQAVGGHQGQWPEAADRLVEQAYAALGWDPRRGNAMLVLPNTAESGTGAADFDAPEASFSDPADDSSLPRFFSMADEY
jgi:hypothetical protein